MTQTETEWKTLSLDVADNVATVTVSNPPMNVVNLDMILELNALVDMLKERDDIHVVVFTSDTDGVFIAGADISMLAEIDEETVALLDQYSGVMDRVATIQQPTIASLPGMTLGGGFELALACDFRFMAEGFGEIGLPEVRLGLLPGWGGTQRLPRLVGHGVATEMIMKGMRYPADTALELGIVHRTFPADELRAQTTKYAQSLAKQAPLALRAIKKSIRAAFEEPGEKGNAVERAAFLKLVQTEDAKEGLTAFLEGRKPEFTGS